MRKISVLLAMVLAATMLIVPAASAADYTLAPDGDSVGVFDTDQGQWTLRDRFGVETSFFFGNPGDYPMMGDWNGDGIDTPGLYRQSDGHVYLRNSNTQGTADVLFFFGNPGDVPIAGDWDGDGDDTISVYRPSNQTFYIINTLGSNGSGLGAADSSFVFGDPGDTPFAGDFNGSGSDTVGLHRVSDGRVYFRNSLDAGSADADFVYGDPGDVIIAGAWQGSATDSVGIFRPADAKFYLNYANAPTAADIDFVLGESTFMPLAGDFGLSSDIVDVAVADGRFTTLAAALGAADLVDTLKSPGPFTVLAPTDDAFAALEASSPGIIAALLADVPALTDILLYHVVSGTVPAETVVTLDSAKTVQGQKVYIKVADGKVMINDAEVIITDIYASNGVIHVLDTVLQPLDIVDTAIAEGSFTTLVAALTATQGTTNLVDALRGTGPFTVFAPTDAAFTALEASSPGILATLLATPGGTLSEILLYHVLSGKSLAADVVAAAPFSPTTLQGTTVDVTLSGSDVKVDAAKVIVTDVLTSNGVIHVIDAVITP